MELRLKKTKPMRFTFKWYVNWNECTQIAHEIPQMPTWNLWKRSLCSLWYCTLNSTAEEGKRASCKHYNEYLGILIRSIKLDFFCRGSSDKVTHEHNVIMIASVNLQSREKIRLLIEINLIESYRIDRASQDQELFNRVCRVRHLS